MKKQIRNHIFVKATFLFALFIAFNSSCYAVMRTNMVSGNWSNSSIWTPAGVPTQGDDIIISAGTTVYYDIYVLISTGGSITINGTLCGQDSFIVVCGGYFLVNNGGLMSGVYIGVTDGVINGNGWVYAENAFSISPCSTGFNNPGNSTVGLPFSCNPTGINEPSLQNILNISPNPFNDELNIAFTVSKPSDLTYEIFDMYGKKLKTYSHHNFAGEFKQSETFENLSAGVYFFQLTLDGETVVKKLVHQ